MASTLTNIGQWLSGGAAKAQYSASSSGRPYDDSALSAGNESGMTDIDGFKTLSMNIPEATVLNFPGDDGNRGSILFEGDGALSFDMTFADFVGAFFDATQGTTADDAQSIYNFYMLNPNNQNFPDLFLLFTQRAPSSVAGSQGNGYYSVLFPLCSARLITLGDMSTGANVSDRGFRVTTNPVSQLPWGETLTVAAHGTAQADGFFFWSEQIPTFDVFIQDNSATSFTLTKTLAGNSQAIAFDGASGASASTLAVTISTNDLTFTAQTSGNITTALYERVS